MTLVSQAKTLLFISGAASVDEELLRKLHMPIGELDLSVRAGNCLESADIRTVGELVQRDETELLAVRSFGKTSLREVKRKLEELRGQLRNRPVPLAGDRGGCDEALGPVEEVFHSATRDRPTRVAA